MSTLVLSALFVSACSKGGSGGDFGTQFSRNWRLVDYLKEGQNLSQQLEAELNRINADSSKTEEWKEANRASLQRIYGDLQAQVAASYLHVTGENASAALMGQAQMGKWVLNNEGRRSIDILSESGTPLTLFVESISDSSLVLETLGGEKLVFKPEAGTAAQ